MTRRIVPAHSEKKASGGRTRSSLQGCPAVVVGLPAAKARTCKRVHLGGADVAAVVELETLQRLAQADDRCEASCVCKCHITREVDLSMRGPLKVR
ncbi:hypothetical protein MRX96_019227 [Rhipicephalus microplus]